MTQKGISAALILFGAALAPGQPARADSPNIALVIGTATYAAMPAVAACARSANVVAAALRARGFTVIERADASSGGIDAGIGEFAQKTGDGGGAAFIYACGYALEFNNRIFLLPATARLARPTDVLTQGVLAKSLIDTINRKPMAAAVIAFDLIPPPDAPSKLTLDTISGVTVRDEVGIVAASSPAPQDRPTPLAAALASELGRPVVQTDSLLAAVQAEVAAAPLHTIALHNPVKAGYLAGAPRAPAPPQPTVTATAPLPAAFPQAAPPQAAPPQAAPPRAIMPDEDQMTDTDRRKVQAALAILGYYSLAVDGRFGAETRAAIRRFQHELRADMTGRLTAAEASRLIENR